MLLQSLTLQNFRTYKKAQFAFDPKTTVIIGPNTSGKSNLLEAITFLSAGKSFRAEKDFQAVHFGEELARIKGKVDDISLEVVLTTGTVAGIKSQMKKFLVNDIAKRRVDFVSHLPTVLFSPEDLDVISGSPSIRRHFLDSVLEQTDKEYRLSSTLYEKALRQRNALLQHAKETGRRNEKEFSYWDELIIRHGNILTTKREQFLSFVNEAKKDVMDMQAVYDKSETSKERLEQYKEAEVGACVTLVGPHRDDFQVFMRKGKQGQEVKLFGSRGQQRLAVLQLKMLQLQYVTDQLGETPLLLLDDIFSELDSGHIYLVQEMIGTQQTILTTTHQEFVEKSLRLSASVIELKL